MDPGHATLVENVHSSWARPERDRGATPVDSVKDNRLAIVVLIRAAYRLECLYYFIRFSLQLS